MKYMALLVLLLATNAMKAQYAESIRTGRPGQAIGPYVLGANVYQLQTGIDHYFRDYEGNAASSYTMVQNSVIRIGFSEKFELNGLVDWQMASTKTNGDLKKEAGLSSTQFGLRFNVLERKGARPGIGVQYRLLLPAESKIYRRAHLGSAIKLATNSKLFGKINVVTNWAAVWTGNKPAPNYNYIFNVSFDITPKLGGFVEMYGELDEWTTNYDGGLSYLLNDNLMLDVYGGWQGQEGYNEFFFSTGISWRLVRRHRGK